MDSHLDDAGVVAGESRADRVTVGRVGEQEHGHLFDQRLHLRAADGKQHAGASDELQNRCELSSTAETGAFVFVKRGGCS
jgi:hypothetical protein